MMLSGARKFYINTTLIQVLPSQQS